MDFLCLVRGLCGERFGVSADAVPLILIQVLGRVETARLSAHS